MKRSEVDMNKISPMMKQYLEIKSKYEDTIIFFRLGDFYEMFFEDAILCSRELELTLTGKNAGLEERIPMCGVPYHAYKSYLDKLIDNGYKVAICEQLTDPKETKGMVERDVIQVVTKGTRLDDSINSKDFNYIGNIYDFEYCYGVCYADLSTGDIYTLILDYDKENIVKYIANKNIKELIVNSKIDREIVNDLRKKYNVLVTFRDDILEDSEYSYVYKDLEDLRLKTTVKHLLSYFVDTKKGNLKHLQKCIKVNEQDYLYFDIHTKNNLELVQTIRNNDKQYSLFWLLDKNKTAMGSRLLKFNIENPLVDKKELEKRYSIIEKLRTEFILRDELRENLYQIYDLERLSSRISYGNLNARDLIQLKNSIKVLPNIKKNLEELNLKEKVETLDELYSLLDKSINEDAPITIKEGSLIKNGYNDKLDELKNVRRNSKNFILNIEQEEKERTGIKNLKVGFNKVFGYYIEVSKGNVSAIKDEYNYERKQTLANCERFITPLLKEKENIILGAEEKIINLEYDLFIEIRDIVRTYIPKLQQISKVLAYIDMLTSFAIVSEENGYIKPTLTDDKVIKIIEENKDGGF